MTSIRWAVLLTVFAAGACTSFDSVDQGVCGNFVLDPGEDCDGAANPAGGTCAAEAEENACFLVCDASSREGCPNGWSCGADGRCRAPSGRFELAEGSPWTFDVDQMAIGDVDGDGFADIIGNEADNIRVRFGSRDADFSDLLSLKTREPTGPVSYANFNDDSLLDAIVPTDAGLFVLLGDAARTLEPVAFSPFSLGESEIEAVALNGTSGLTEGIMFVDGTARAVYNPDNVALYSFPAGGDMSDLRFPLPVANIDGLGVEETVLAFAGLSRAIVLSMNSVTGAVQEVGSVQLPPGRSLAGGALFADYDGDGDQDLLLEMSGLGGRVAIAINTGASLAPTAVIEPDNPLNRKAGARFPIAAANLNQNERADYVYTDGIFLTTPLDAPGEVGPPTGVFLSPAFDNSGRWADGAIGDFNRDGHNDVVLATKTTTLDVFLGTGEFAFNGFRIEAEGTIRHVGRNIRVADFDGDFLDDIAFARENEDAEEDELVVVFGAADAQFSEPLSMGRLGTILSITPLLVGAAQANVIMDAVVISENAGGLGRSAAIFEGSSSRRMVSPFALNEPGGDTHTPVRAVVGNFVADDDGRKDIVVIAEPPVALQEPAGIGEDNGTDFVRQPSVWLVPGLDGSGALDTAATTFKKLDGDDGLGFEIQCSTWAAGELDGENSKAELVGLDATAQCGFDLSPTPASLMVVREEEGVAHLTHEELVVEGSPLYNTSSVLLADLDADGDVDALTSFLGVQNRNSSIHVLWNDGGALSVSTDPVDSIGEEQALASVTTAHLNGDVFPDLVYMTRFNTGSAGAIGPGHLYGLVYDPEAKDYGAPEPMGEYDRARLVQSGDLNGDGLDDLVIVVGDELEVQLAVPQEPLGGAE